MKTKKILSLGCLSVLVLLAVLIGTAWLTGNIRPMTEAEKQALEDRIKSHQPAPSIPPPPTWPIGLPRTGPELTDPWSYAEDKIVSDPQNWFLEDAKYRLDDPAAAHRALEETLKDLFLDEMPKWQDTVDAIAEQASRDYRQALRDRPHCEKIEALLTERFLSLTLLIKGTADYQVVLVDYGIFPGKVSYLNGRNPGWRVDAGVHQDPVPEHWSAWKSQEVAAAFLQWIAAFPEAKLYVLRFTDDRFGRPRHGFYTLRNQKGSPPVLSYWQPDELGEIGDVFDPNSPQVDPHYVASKIRPATAEFSENDLAAAAAGKIDLNELLLDFNPLKVHPPTPPLTEEQRQAIVKEVLEKAAKTLRKLHDGK